MQGGHRPFGVLGKEGKMDQVEMEVDNVEFVPSAMNLVQHRHVRGEIRLEIAGIEPDRLITAGHQRGLGPCLRAGEQGHLVAELHERVREVRDNPFRAAIESRRHGLVQRGNLGDPHSDDPSRTRTLPATDLNMSHPIPQVEVTGLHCVDHSNQRMNTPHVPLVASYYSALSDCWRSGNAMFTSYQLMLRTARST